ncbi:D-amino-acid transaminase [Macrococcoides caseolyticum]|uniref:D-amino-acid transaminase n=1 Tax=Macrococcoides caseolyticum TaxID=69966 RepID=UPI001F40B957|nr:D-amino-acid transaminase [Macrococcus caseolyticus]MCE4956384.1 D-amino-acid transaminase [Macrococcus caseolyticus]
MVIFLNGNYVSEDEKISYNDRGIQFGDGIYEVVRVYSGKLYTATEHFERLVRSANEIAIKSPYTVDEYIAICEQLIENNQIHDGSIYIQVTRGDAVRNHAYPENSRPNVLLYTNVVERPLQELKDGIKVITAEDFRWLRCDIKSLNLLGNIMNKQKAVENNAKEAIQIRDGIVTEGASSNVFIVKDGKIKTHPANQLILNGITRRVIQQMAEALRIPFEEETFDEETLKSADEVFISSTTQEVMPVIQIDEKPVHKGQVGPVVKQLQAQFEAQISALQA